VHIPRLPGRWELPPRFELSRPLVAIQLCLGASIPACWILQGETAITGSEDGKPPVVSLNANAPVKRTARLLSEELMRWGMVDRSPYECTFPGREGPHRWVPFEGSVLHVLCSFKKWTVEWRTSRQRTVSPLRLPVPPLPDRAPWRVRYLLASLRWRRGEPDKSTVHCQWGNALLSRFFNPKEAIHGDLLQSLNRPPWPGDFQRLDGCFLGQAEVNALVAGGHEPDTTCNVIIKETA